MTAPAPDPDGEKLRSDAGPCPIFGRKMEMGGGPTIAEMYVSHKCPEATLRAIDGAHKREETALADPTNRSKRQKRKDADDLAR